MFYLSAFLAKIFLDENLGVSSCQRLLSPCLAEIQPCECMRASRMLGGGGFPTGFVQGCKGSQRRSPTVSMVVNVFFLSWGNREHVQNPFATKNLKKHRPWTSPDRNVAFTKYLFGAVLQGLATICHFLGTFETICQLPEMQANLVGSRNVKVHGPSPAVRLSKMTKKIEQKNS